MTLFYPCMYSILVDVSVKLFALLALRLTNFENHRTQTTFVNRLVLKVSQKEKERRNKRESVCTYLDIYVCDTEKEKFHIFLHFFLYRKSSYIFPYHHYSNLFHLIFLFSLSPQSFPYLPIFALIFSSGFFLQVYNVVYITVLLRVLHIGS